MACGDADSDGEGGTGGGTQRDYSDPTALADKYVLLRQEFDTEFCEYFDPDGSVFGSGTKTTARGDLVLDGFGTWSVVGDSVCATYGNGAYCMRVIIGATTIDWFSENQEFLYTTTFNVGERFVQTAPCGTRRLPPTTLRIVGIRITSWPERKPDGSHWDLSAFASSRRPDLRVILADLDAEPGASQSRYTSDIFSNAHSQSHLFTGVTGDPTSPDNLNPALPVYIRYDHRFRVLLIDDDIGGTSHDEVGRIVRTPDEIAQDIDDLSGQQTHTFPDDDGRGVTFQVIGEWQ
jgi:hypothetical protein